MGFPESNLVCSTQQKHLALWGLPVPVFWQLPPAGPGASTDGTFVSLLSGGQSYVICHPVSENYCFKIYYLVFY